MVVAVALEVSRGQDGGTGLGGRVAALGGGAAGDREGAGGEIGGRAVESQGGLGVGDLHRVVTDGGGGGGRGGNGGRVEGVEAGVVAAAALLVVLRVRVRLGGWPWVRPLFAVGSPGPPPSPPQPELLAATGEGNASGEIAEIASAGRQGWGRVHTCYYYYYHDGMMRERGRADR